ncbi:MAG: class F sortase [Thermomicrobiales bacterium]
MSDHVLGSAPRTETAFPGAATPVTRRRFVLSSVAAVFAGSAIVPKVAAAKQSIFAPAKISIPGIGLSASIQQLHIVDGVMETPNDPWKVGWYSQLSFPGQGANVVMAGHKDYRNVGPAVFWDLTLLRSGDEMTLTSGSNQVLTYVVDQAEAFLASTPPSEYTSPGGGEQLTLITCSGSYVDGAYDERLIVRASLRQNT